MMIESVDKKMFERVWKIVEDNGTEERHFNTLQGMRGMASAWLLAGLIAIGLVTSKVMNLGIDPVLKEAIILTMATEKVSPSDTIRHKGYKDASHTQPLQNIPNNPQSGNLETSPADVTDDDFIADIQAILTGQKVFYPFSKAAIEKDQLGRSQSTLNQNDGNDFPEPESKNSHAIFNRIAQGMQYANPYYLGNVGLENRFADFNKISDLQQKTAQKKKSKNDKTPLGKASSGSVVDSADFIQDLEAIKKQKNTVNVDPQIATSSTITDKWDRIANEVFDYANYDGYLAKELKATTFFGQSLLNLNDAMVQNLRKVEADLTNSQGSGYKAPFANSTLRKKTGMHGWGMAIDFDVEKNPYVLNENAEGQLNKELIGSYDNIAKLMLGKTQSDLRKLKSGRSAFGAGSIGDVYDVLREESDAMKRYFSLMNDDAALQSFIELEWAIRHPDQPPPDFAKTKAQMKNDYEVLGGKTDTGWKRPTGEKEDRSFAPTSFGGKGDPATGFLNLGKEFVEAMTNAGFAWGAIDISGEPGDIQHFDLRLQGNGAKVYNLLLKYK